MHILLQEIKYGNLNWRQKIVGYAQNTIQNAPREKCLDRLILDLNIWMHLKVDNIQFSYPINDVCIVWKLISNNDILYEMYGF